MDKHDEGLKNQNTPTAPTNVNPSPNSTGSSIISTSTDIAAALRARNGTSG